jgi:hypothetical protein
VLTTAGQVDGRPPVTSGEQRPALYAFATELSERVLADLSAPVMPDCSAKEWQC